jgi:hypothetical protein
MPVQLNVDPPVITINQDVTFMVTDQNGEISEKSEQGVFSSDTRFISHYRILANGEPWERLTSSAVAYNRARLYFTNRRLLTEESEIPAGTLSLAILRVALQYTIGEQFVNFLTRAMECPS